MGRLINEDVLIDKLLTENQRCITSTGHELTMSMVVSFINHAPTAYDVEKVVTETRKELDKLLYICDLEDTTKVYDFYDWLEKSIRKGGINDDNNNL